MGPSRSPSWPMAPHPSAALIEEKRALRRTMDERRSSLPADDRAARSGAAAALVLALPEMARAGGTIAGYVAVRGEIDPAPILDAARARGAAVALPRVGAGAPRMVFHRADAG